MITKAYDGIGKILVIGDFVEDPDTEHQYEVREILENNEVVLRDLFTGEYMNPIDASECRLVVEEDFED
jgi:hypothetical protein